ncbi:MAG: citramalate synthase [Verrucomicrobiae bacterium]|nr:citramalate synthase [Verrucomicrobiae bacterium]
MRPEIEIYDTTLRDGSQGLGINFSVLDKLRIAEKLDAFGVHYIEGGWPASNPKDLEFFMKARTRKFKRAKLAAFGATRRKGMRADKDPQVQMLVEAGTPVVTVFGKTWLLHVRHVLGTTPEENLAMISDTIRYLKAHKKFVIYDAEHAFDGYKSNPEYAVATWLAAAEAGADLVVLCDTNGGCLPGEIAKITAVARAKLAVPIGIHTHNDTGLGVANALAAIEAGATHVQGTINGYGERTGNCNLTSVIPIIELKLRKRCVPPGSLRKLKELSQFVDEIANVRHDPRQPWVGDAAFAHKGGTHVNAVQKLIRSYEHVDPAAIGNVRRVLISDLAGRSNIILKARELGFRLSPDTPELKEILHQVKKLEHQGYEFEAAEGSLAVLISKILKHREPPFAVQAYHVSMRRDGANSVCEATVKVRVDNQFAHTVAEGDGPVHALDIALRAALVKFYPQLKKVKLTDYKVRILESSAGTAATTRVLIESTDGKRQWGTVGVSDNIVEASLQALVDSMEYALLRK